VFIKPHKADIVNTRHLMTDRGEYTHAYRVACRWALLSDRTVSVSARAGGPGAPDKLKWDYSVDGSAEFKPEVMFGDGHSIWMRMPAKAQTWPVPMYKAIASSAI
jgi:type IV secretion system protein VirB9